jgi:large conductance mechanosensitive channel
MSFFQDFKKFAMRGNVIDLAVAVVIGAAFGKIVAALVDGIIMPIIGLLLGEINIANKSFTVGNAVLKWGMFLQAVVDFTIIALSIFVVVRLISYVQPAKVEEPKKSTEEVLLTEIRDLLKQKSL